MSVFQRKDEPVSRKTDIFYMGRRRDPCRPQLRRCPKSGMSAASSKIQHPACAVQIIFQSDLVDNIASGNLALIFIKGRAVRIGADQPVDALGDAVVAEIERDHLPVGREGDDDRDILQVSVISGRIRSVIHGRGSFPALLHPLIMRAAVLF